jgi:hypothetical protein
MHIRFHPMHHSNSQAVADILSNFSRATKAPKVQKGILLLRGLVNINSNVPALAIVDHRIV